MKYFHPLEIPRSMILSGMEWIGPRTACPIEGIHGDTHPMTWAADDEIYMSAGDPNWALIDGKPRGVTWTEAFELPDLYPHMGGVDVEKLIGHGSNFSIEQVNTMPGLLGPGGLGAKPSGMISVDGVLYLAVQNLLGKKPTAHREHSQHGSDATILRSDDKGKSWYPDIQTGLTQMEKEQYDRRAWQWRTPPEERTSWKGWTPMFPGSIFGGPSFIQFGRDNSDRIDDFVYAISGDQWDNGRELRVGRVSKDRVQDVDAWRWAQIRGDGGVTWMDQMAQSEPVLMMDGHISLPEMVYLPSVKRFLLVTWGLHRDFHVEAGSELTLLESENPWGPFRLVYYEELWDAKEVCPYCPRIPLKWFDHQALSGWLFHSGNWHSPEPFYKPHVRPFRLIRA